MLRWSPCLITGATAGGGSERRPGEAPAAHASSSATPIVRARCTRCCARRVLAGSGTSRGASHTPPPARTVHAATPRSAGSRWRLSRLTSDSFTAQGFFFLSQVHIRSTHVRHSDVSECLLIRHSSDSSRPLTVSRLPPTRLTLSPHLSHHRSQVLLFAASLPPHRGLTVNPSV